jgi:hypothetical protein
VLERGLVTINESTAALRPLRANGWCQAGALRLLTGLLIGLAWGAGVAGDLNAPAGPDDPASALYTLEDLYNRLDAGTAGAKRSGAFAEPASGPTAGTMYTLDELMAKMPARDAANGAAPADCAAGKTFWGLLSGSWGLQTGTASAGADVTGGDGLLSFNIPNGLYAGDKTCTAADSDLTAGNIKTGVTLFGVLGSYSGTQPTGDATPADVLGGKTFSNADGTGKSGSMPDNEGDNASTGQDYGAGNPLKLTAPTGFYDGDDPVTATESEVAALDTAIATGNIRSGVSIFGVAGDSNVVNTSSGDAVAGDIRSGKKAWVDGAEVSGALYGGCSCQSGTLSGTRWCDNGDGTVTDLLGDTTNGNLGRCLVWLKDANCSANLAGVNKTSTLNWDDANIWSSAVSNGSCSLSDGSSIYEWRLPTRAELEGLTNGTDAVLSGSPGPFSGVQSNFYWSSTSIADNSSSAWNLGLYNGNVNNDIKVSGPYVWPVRGGQ